MTFNINNQNAGQINNVAGDQHISGGQHATVTVDTAREAVRSLEQAVAVTPLPDDAAATARAHVREMAAELGKERPDRATVADHGRRLTALLSSAGSLVSAGSALLGPLQTLAGWLGQLGEPILRLIAHAV